MLERVGVHHKRVCVLEKVDVHHKRVCVLEKVDVHHKRVCGLEKVYVQVSGQKIDISKMYLMLLLKMMMKMQEGRVGSMDWVKS